MNRFICMGRLAQDLEVRYSNDNKPVVKFNFAVNRKFKREGEAEADFFTCVAFGKIAETLEKCSINKGTKLLIEGEVRNNNYTDKDGKKVYGTQILVNSFEFCESKSAAGNTQNNDNYNTSSDGFMNIPNGLDEELPFN